MTPSEVVQILQRLSVIETKIDAQQNDDERGDDRKRIRNLEFAVLLILSMWAKDIFHIPTPFS
jgi:hypothetical protein